MKRRPQGQQGDRKASRATARPAGRPQGQQGDRKGRPYYTRASQADSSYSRGDLAVALKGGASRYSGSATGPNLARPSAMADATPDSAVSRATRRAFLMALAFERP